MVEVRREIVKRIGTIAIQLQVAPLMLLLHHFTCRRLCHEFSFMARDDKNAKTWHRSENGKSSAGVNEYHGLDGGTRTLRTINHVTVFWLGFKRGQN